MAKYNFAIVLGRFQIYTRPHRELLKKAASIADNVIVGIGSANRSSSPKFPFTVTDRVDMIVNDREVTYRKGGLHFVALNDSLYNDDKWISGVQDGVYNKIVQVMNAGAPHAGIHGYSDAKVAIVGCKKDPATAYYLGLFPNWKLVEVDVIEDGNGSSIDATKLRSLYYEHGVEDSDIGRFLPDSTTSFLRDFELTMDYDRLTAWYRHIQDEKLKFAKYPYKGHLNIACADSLVTQMGHIALVTRNGPDGRGLLALAGGHKSEFETFRGCAMRETYEELQMEDERGRIPQGRLAGFIKGQGVQFDHPDRSERGCVHTTVFHLDLPSKPQLFKIRGGDDANPDPNKTRMYAFSELRMDRFFEDHGFIIEAMLGIDIP